MADKEMTFEAAMARLEEIVRALEGGSAGLDASLGLFEEGISLVKLCNAKLEGAEQKVKLLAAGGGGIGLAFQIVDDVLDVYGSTETLGKSVGSDAKNEKSTFLSFMNADEAMAYAARVTKEATDAIAGYPASETLISLGEWLLHRTY